MLLDFFELYGLNFNYVMTGITVDGTGSYFPKAHSKTFDDFYQPTRLFQIGIENPLEPGMDVGRASYRIGLVKRSFEVSYKCLLSDIISPVDPPMSLLAVVIPPEAWMQARVGHFGKNDDILRRWDWKGIGESNGKVTNSNLSKDDVEAASRRRKRRAADFIDSQEIEEDLEVDEGVSHTQTGKKEEKLNKRQKRQLKQQEKKQEQEAAAVSSSSGAVKGGDSSLTGAATKAEKAKIAREEAAVSVPKTTTTINSSKLKFYIYMCSNATRKECFDRQMFGSDRGIRAMVDDVLFLYNFNRREFEGPFRAASNSRLNIAQVSFGSKGCVITSFPWTKFNKHTPKIIQLQGAWGGRFPYQIKVVPFLKEAIGKITTSVKNGCYARVSKSEFDREVKMESKAIPSTLTPGEGKKMLMLCLKCGWNPSAVGVTLAVN